MPLLLGDDEVEALEAALSFVDALPSAQHGAVTQTSSTAAAAPSPSAFIESNTRLGIGDEGEVRLDAELDRLLLETLSSSSEHDSDTTAMTTASTALSMPTTEPSRHVVPSPLPQVANIGAPCTSGQTHRGSRTAKNSNTTLAKTKRRVKVNPNRARDERKHELAYLRNKVEQMERELGTIHHRRRARGINNVNRKR
ncbi:M96 mating-specific protein family [Phytophthora palmivora]|uniref:M96 mating-specific protein family n=1 Tax=Phytophthora palmivora TaxID=4796 RepID=A0A2P4Y486_9STRA|nr:M96 mating-specific protein family [Phytophthora palmivora]